MKIWEIAEILNAESLTPSADLDRDVNSACGSDMMSDVLAFVKNQAVLLTGLTNPQTVRTAGMMDMVCIVFVRGKRPDEATLELAREMDIAVFSTPCTMYMSCGMLYARGLRGGNPVC